VIEQARPLVAVIREVDDPPESRSFLGLPPELTGGKDQRVRLPLPSFIVVEGTDDHGGGFFLLRFTAEGTWLTDTWHETVEFAKEQAVSEFEHALGEWHEVPVDTDPVSLGIRLFQEQRAQEDDP